MQQVPIKSYTMPEMANFYNVSVYTLKKKLDNTTILNSSNVRVSFLDSIGFKKHDRTLVAKQVESIFKLLGRPELD